MSIVTQPHPSYGRRIVEFDGLRGVSVIMVVASHAACYFFDIKMEPLRTFFMGMGALGVEIFFVISGFVITRLLLEEQRTTGHVSLRAFYTRRFFRILPAYWTYSLAVVIVTLCGVLALKQMGGIPPLTGFVISALFLSNLIYPGWFWGHTWSLSVEEQFYIFFPLLFRRFFQGSRRYVVLGLLLAAIYLFSFFADWLLYLAHTLAFRLLPHIDWNKSAPRFYAFAYITVGVALAVFGDHAAKMFKRTPGWSYMLNLALLVIWPLILPITFPGELVNDLHPLLAGIAVGWILAHPRYFGFLRWPVAQFIGACSFSIYLWQQMFLGLSEHYNPAYPRILPLSLLLMFNCAILSYYFIEKNFIILGRRLTANKAHATKYGARFVET